MAKKKKTNKNNKKNKKPVPRVVKVCVICERPHKQKTQSCSNCNRELRELVPIVEPFSKYKRISLNKVINIKLKYNVEDVFDFIKSNPRVWKTLDKRPVRMKMKRDLRKELGSSEYREESYNEWIGEIPMYIYKVMQKHPSKKLITLSGEKLNPNIHYLCLKCNEEQVQKFDDLNNNKGHDCQSTKSSGEAVVENYLKTKGIRFKTQYNTLKCINPITKRQLPYDIEIPEFKVIVEVQGGQHLEFLEYFHGSIENFYYQQRKDSYKKRFAEKKGYKVIYIYYDEIKDGTFKNKLKFKE